MSIEHRITKQVEDASPTSVKTSANHSNLRIRMSKRKKIIVLAVLLIIGGYISYRLIKKINPNPKYEVGQKLDSLNGVYVYYNGGVDHVLERNTTTDGYNLGLKYQCVEFVKRYYYEYYHHRMPDSYGNAKDFFNPEITDGSLNRKRNLLQYKQGGKSKPKEGDLMIFDGHAGNSYGHVAIVSAVIKNEVEIIQQNPGPFAESRVKFSLDSSSQGFTVGHERALGWLRVK
jgi:surface antigen